MKAFNWVASGIVLCVFVSGALAQNKPRAGSAAASSSADSTCIVADLKAIALETHDVQVRGENAKAWLQKFGPNCSPFQIAIISANRNAWLGHADSPNFVAMIDRINEMKNINMTYFPSANNAAAPDANAPAQVGAGASSRPKPVVQNNQLPGMAQPLVQPLVQPNVAPAAAQAQQAPRPLQQPGALNPQQPAGAAPAALGR
jgi:hypothetical protein